MSFRPALRTGIKPRQLRQPGYQFRSTRCLTGDLMSSKIQTYAELQKMIRKALREQHPEWIDANGKCTLCDSYEARFAKLVRIFAHRSAGAKIAGRGPVRAETLRRRSQFYSYPVLNSAGQGTQTDEQHECRAQRDEDSCV